MVAVMVTFYRVDHRYPERPRWTGDFDKAEVHRRTSLLDYSAPSSRIHKRLFGEELVCISHGDLNPILGGYSKDLFRPLRTEMHGKIHRVSLNDDEGPVKTSYVSFYDHSVAGVLTLEQGSPSAGQIETWITCCLDLPILFRELRHLDVRSRIMHNAADLRDVEIRIFNWMRRTRHKGPGKIGRVWDSLDSLAAVSDSEGIVRVGLHAPREPHERLRWLEALTPLVEQLLETQVLDDLDSAYVGLSNDRRINLKDPRLAVQVPVELDSRRRLDEDDAVDAMDSAYQAVRDLVEARSREVSDVPYGAGDYIEPTYHPSQRSA